MLHILSHKCEPDPNDINWYFHTFYLSDGSVYQSHFHMTTSEGFPLPFAPEDEQDIIQYIQRAYKQIKG